MHDLTCESPKDESSDNIDGTEHETNDHDDSKETVLVNAAKSSQSKLPPGDIRRVMSKSNTRSVNMARIIYNVSASKTSKTHDISLVDRGANGGL